MRGDYVFYQWRLCFDGIRAWYVNQEESGDGVLGTDEPLRAIDMQQEGGNLCADMCFAGGRSSIDALVPAVLHDWGPSGVPISSGPTMGAPATWYREPSGESIWKMKHEMWHDGRA